MAYQGAYINLDRSTGRKDAFLLSLKSAHISPQSYKRFSAIEPVSGSYKRHKGLKSDGELGLYLSLISLLEEINSSSYEEIVHIAEDDSAFSCHASSAIANLRNALMDTSRAKLRPDIVFLDYLLNPDLCRLILALSEEDKKQTFCLLPAEKYYMACTGSFLVRKSSAPYIAELLSRYINSSIRIAPVDIFLRNLFRGGLLKGSMISPSIGAPDWEQDLGTLIQITADDSLRASQRSHLLLRILMSEIQTPYWCAMQLSSLYNIESPLTKNSTKSDFITFFDSVKKEHKLPRF